MTTSIHEESIYSYNIDSWQSFQKIYVWQQNYKFKNQRANKV